MFNLGNVMSSIPNNNIQKYHDDYYVNILSSLKMKKNETEESIDILSPYDELSSEEYVDVEAPSLDLDSDSDYIDVEH
jgi:hypothetical protein